MEAAGVAVVGGDGSSAEGKSVLPRCSFHSVFGRYCFHLSFTYS